MARYIDTSKVTIPKGFFEDLNVPKLLEWLNNQPAADVVPKSEVAREIFEEIDKIIDKHHSECYEYEDGDECDTAITYISYISCDIDDLKKKYTEDQT